MHDGLNYSLNVQAMDRACVEAGDDTTNLHCSKMGKLRKGNVPLRGR